MFLVKGNFWKLGFKTPYEDTPVAAIDFTGMTHVCQIGLAVIADGSVTDITLHTTDLIPAAHAVGTKVLVNVTDAVGSFATTDFNSAVTSHLSTLVSNIVSAVDSGGYDGIDVDWETNLDYTKLLTFLQAMRAALGTKIISCDFLIAATLTESDLSAHAAVLDRVNIMSYGQTFSGDKTWFDNATHDRAGDTGAVEFYSQKLAVDRYVAAGVPLRKINLLMFSGGVQWTGGSPTANGPRQTQSVGASNSEVTYTNMVANHATDMASATIDSVALVPWFPIVSPAVGWINYNDPTSAAAKVQFARGQGAGGCGMFSLDKDYISTGATQALKHPIWAAIQAA